MSKTAQPYLTTCPVGCGIAPLATQILLEEGCLQRCPHCGQLFSSCSVSQYERALQKWDTASGTSPDMGSAARYQQVVSRRLKGALGLMQPHAGRPSLLDVGCSSGDLLGIARNMGFKVSGVEPAANAAQTAIAKGFDVFPGYLEDAAFPPESFDVITLFELLEHLSNPTALFVECSRILKPGGIIVLNTPNADSWTAKFMEARWAGFSLEKMGGHISFFSPQSIKVLADRAGLEVAKLETRNVRFFEKGQCNPFLYRLMKILAELAALPARAVGRGHDMLVYLRRV